MKRDEWNDDIAYAMSLVRMVTLPTGVWPLQDYNFSANVRTVAAVTSHAILVILGCHESFTGCNDADAYLDCIMLIGCNVMAMIKIVCYRVYARNLRNNFERAVNDYVETSDGKSLGIMRRHAYVARCMASGLIFFAYFACTVLTVAPLIVGNSEEKETRDFNETRRPLSYPIPSDCTLGSLDLPMWMYYVMYSSIFVFLINSCNAFVGSDGLFICITLHVCGQVEILKSKFTELSSPKEKRRENFDNVLKRYRDLLILADLLAETISVVLVAQLFVSSVIICMLGFQLVLSLEYGDMLMFIKSFFILSTYLLQLFAYSYVGDYLRTQMESVGDALYESMWYKFPMEWTKDVIFVLMRSQHVVQIAAASFFPVNMQTFMSILKTSLSYLSVLRVMM